MSLEFRLPVHAKMLFLTRGLASAYLRDHRLEEEVLYDIILALDEACANVVRHAFLVPQAINTFGVALDVRDGSVYLEVSDHGVGLNPKQFMGAAHPLSVNATSGRGLMLIRALMNDVRVEAADGGGTRLMMEKSFSATQRSFPGGSSPHGSYQKTPLCVHTAPS